MSLSSPILKQVVIISGVTVGAMCLILVGIAAFSVHAEQTYQNRIYPGISINRVDVGGLTPEQAKQKVDRTIQTALQNGITFQVASTSIVLTANDIQSASPTLIRYDLDTSVAEAQRTGRVGSFFRKAFARLDIMKRGRTVPLANTIEEEAIHTFISSSTEHLLPVAQDAQLIIDARTNEPSVVRVQPEQSGQTIDWQTVAVDLRHDAASFNFAPINAPLITVQPRWKESDVATLKPQAEAWLAKAPFSLRANGKELKVDNVNLASWINTTTTNNQLALELSADQMRSTLDGWLSGIIQPAKEGFIDVEDGKLKTFIAPEQGMEIDMDKTRTDLLAAWEKSTSSPAVSEITLMSVTPKINGEDAEQLGIREVIGIGTSNFSGSPTNRRYNIKLGAQKVHGTLLAPGAEFSMIKTLGEIDGAHGWLPELVIKGNKTTPEFGGGLCQIGTTAFRGALNTGLLITERRNHSYRVRYYEPAGTDATIYDPSPDFKFKNDTPTSILITTKIVGDDVTFTFWGTKDGRTVDLAKPIISNITAPPPKKMIETTDLAPGKVKCTESAHAGATARLDYAVTYPSGETKKVTFTSVYRPWGAVCLVGSTNPGTTTDGGVDETGVNNPN